MKAPNLKKSILALTAIAVLAGCATPPSDIPPGALKVVYSQYYPDGSYLKEQPTEVRLVTREVTTKNVATQVGLNLLLLSVGALSFQGFSKDDLKGRTVDGPTERSHLRNPIPTDFVTQLQARVDTAVRDNDRWKAQTYTHPLVVGGGYARLVYESLADTDEATYRLKTDLVIYRKVEGASIPVCTSLAAVPLGRRQLPSGETGDGHAAGCLRSQGGGIAGRAASRLIHPKLGTSRQTPRQAPSRRLRQVPTVGCG